jgi:peptidoglycan/xylan/chitin deacetylase (PgdA/CDA1 family)
MWDVDPEDYKKEGEDLLRMKINGMKLQSGSIILLHDDNPATVNVLLDIIKKVREAGFSFGTIE